MSKKVTENFNIFIYSALKNSLELLEEEIDIPADLDSEVLDRALLWFSDISEISEFEFVQGDSEGYFYISEFFNNDKLLRLQEYVEKAHIDFVEAQASEIEAALEGKRGWGD